MTAGQLPLGSPAYKTARTQAGAGGVIFARAAFALTDPASVQNFVMKIQRNDGIIVWLNGRELLRSNVPGDKVSADTRATHAVSKAEGETVKESRVTGYRRKALANANILAVALVPHGDGPADAFLNLSIDANVPEEWNVSSTIDRKSLPARLGAAWEAIPEPARSLLLPE